MASTKTYQTHLNSYSGLFWVSGKQKRISFDGGTANSSGIYTTNDKAEQRSIEASAKFREGSIYLFREYPSKGREEVKPKAVQAPKPKPQAQEAKKEITPDKAQADNTPVKVYAGIATVQAAAKALRTDFKLLADEVSNKAKILAKAKELNVTFPDLPV